ncbi:unnamed protein product [Rotaria magnacalcarata]|nr:unnamed protein product [Rotaria magnacalcarata]
MKTRTQQKQVQTTKRINMDATPSRIVTPVKQRRLIDQIVNTTENTSTNSLAIENISMGLKSSMMTTPSGKRPLFKRAIPTPNPSKK